MTPRARGISPALLLGRWIAKLTRGNDFSAITPFYNLNTTPKRLQWSHYMLFLPLLSHDIIVSKSYGPQAAKVRGKNVFFCCVFLVSPIIRETVQLLLGILDTLEQLNHSFSRLAWYQSPLSHHSFVVHRSSLTLLTSIFLVHKQATKHNRISCATPFLLY